MRTLRPAMGYGGVLVVFLVAGCASAPPPAAPAPVVSWQDRCREVLSSGVPAGEADECRNMLNGRAMGGEPLRSAVVDQGPNVGQVIGAALQGMAEPTPPVEHSGCCSHHGGVCGCDGTHAPCCDQTISRSCGCD